MSDRTSWVITRHQAILDREAADLERQQLRAAQILHDEEDEIKAHLDYKEKTMVRSTARRRGCLVGSLSERLSCLGFRV